MPAADRARPAKSSGSHPSQQSVAADQILDRNSPPSPAKEDGAICFICAEPVVYYALGSCNHRTCHICAVRLKVLYKKEDCSYCKTPLPKIIVTTSPEKDFDKYSVEDLPYGDSKLGMVFENWDMKEEVLTLLNYNCPESTCDDVRDGWIDLRRHIKRDHGRALCDLCTREKKIFVHEHSTYTADQLRAHIDHGDSPPAKNKGKGRAVQSTFTPTTSAHTGFTGHPLCGFCNINFYDSDELFKHCRERHEQCFICKRSETGRDAYQRDWAALESHFELDHFPCHHPSCVERKFVVFETSIDLQAHQLSEHGTLVGGDKRAQKEARRVETNFTYQGSARGRFSRPPEPQTVNPGSTGSRAFKFGSRLTDTSTDDSDWLSVATRRLSDMVDSPEIKLISFRAAVMSYRSSEMAAGDLLDVLSIILDRKTDNLRIIVASVAGALENQDKQKELIEAWSDLDGKPTREQDFPSLAPLSPSSNAQRAQTTTSIRKKPLAKRRSQNDPNIWARVEQAATTSGTGPSSGGHVPKTRPTAFPALAAPKPTVAPTSNRPTAVPGTSGWASNQRQTAWTTSQRGQPSRSVNDFPPPSGLTAVGSSRQQDPAPTAKRTPVAIHSKDFPGLPTSTVHANRTMQRAQMGLAPRAVGPVAWGGAQASGTPAEVEQANPPHAAKGGKGGKKGKQILYTSSLRPA